MDNIRILIGPASQTSSETYMQGGDVDFSTPVNKVRGSKVNRSNSLLVKLGSHELRKPKRPPPQNYTHTLFSLSCIFLTPQNANNDKKRGWVGGIVGFCE